MATEKAAEMQLEFTYENQKKPSLMGIDAAVTKGSFIVLCGSSGCGKTTLLRCMNQLIPQFYEGSLKGFCRIAGENLNGLSIGETGKLAASVFQDPRSQFFTLNSSSELAFGLENFGEPRERIISRVNETFRQLHLETLENRDVFSLSSGERQLIAIAAAWALDTDLLLLDEPTANLDEEAIRRLMELLHILKEHGKTVIISEHRLWYLRDLADEYWFMENGKIEKKLTAAEMHCIPSDERERMGLRTLNLKSLQNSVKHCQKPKVSHRFTAAGISFSYEKERSVLENLTLNAETGEVIGLIGRNGCGKTSFGKLAAGLLKPDTGRFLLDGKQIKQTDLRKNSIFIMQEAEFQFFTNSVMNELTYGRKPDAEEKAKIKELLQSVDLWKCRNQHPFSLSGGQMQKLVLLLAYLSPKPIAVLDEPTAGLDYRSLQACAALIREMQKTKLVFVITHDLELMAMVCTRCLNLTQGCVGMDLDLTQDENFSILQNTMESWPVLQKDGEKHKEVSCILLDPRTKLLTFLLAMTAGIGADLTLIGCTYLSVVLEFIYERRFRPAAAAVCSMAGIIAVYELFPSVVTAFLVSFFPRMLLICFGAWTLSDRQDVPRVLAALRKLRLPEKLIMVMSVTFRFFPVLRKDLAIMNQSIQTRGFFTGISQKLRAAPEYLEILVVPMVFRVIRIAEALSASAETRGISLTGRRDSCENLHIKAADISVICISAVLFTAGIIL